MSELNYDEWEQRLSRSMAILMDIAGDVSLNDMENDHVNGLYLRLKAIEMILDVYRATMYAKHLKDERKGGSSYRAYEVPEGVDITKVFPGLEIQKWPSNKDEKKDGENDS